MFLLAETIFDLFCLMRQFFYRVETYFSTNVLFWVVEMDFLDSTNHKLFLPSSGNVIFNESFIPAIGEGFSFQWKPSTLLETSFLLTNTITDMSGNYFLKTDLILASENLFFSQWNPFSSIVSNILQEVLHPGWWKHIFQFR